MIILTIVLIILLCLKIKYNTGEALSRNNTETWKGAGILVVFIDHIRGYFSQYEPSFQMSIDTQFLSVYGMGTKYMVCLFLFFSGYGVTKSIILKGNTYVKDMPKRRLLPTFINFDIAVLLFLIVDLLLNIDVPIEKFLLSLIAWESIGNSNWYIFAILCCYLFSYFSSILTKNAKQAILLTAVLSLCYLMIMGHIKEPWWSNVIMGYTGGGIFAVWENKTEKIISAYYWWFLIASLLLFVSLFKFSNNLLICNISAIVFTFIIILLTYRLDFDNDILRWFGKNLFPIYIYQRVPMIIMSNKWPDLIVNHPYAYFIMCFIITLAIAKYCYLYKYKS